VPALDAVFMGPWNGTADAISTATELIAALSPMAFAAFAGDDWLECAVITAESLLWASAAKDLLKYAFPRLRPWTYYGYSAVPADSLGEAWISFPSGHTTVAFAGAAALATIALSTDKLGPAGPWLAAGGLGLAATTGILRMAAGAHFLSDVLAGAALGAGIGWLTAFFHLKSASAPGGEAPAVSLSPTASGLKISIALD
jgi:undecaprenyl-diphosphatase